MTKYFVFLFFLFVLTCPSALPQAKSNAESIPTITAKTAGFEKLLGYVPLYWDAKAGKLWAEVSDWGVEFLYVNSLPTGVGSNDIGLDRGQLGRTRVVRWERSGPKVLLVQSNYDFRAISDSEDERRTVRESFAESVIWGFDAAAEEDGRVLVDATGFFLRDTHDVAGTLRTMQGNFRLDPLRSAFYLPRTKNFPLNTEVEVTLTFEGDEPGEWARQVTPTPQAITVRQHHSFVKLPELGYKMRPFDPRAGYFGIGFSDYATPVGEPLVKRFIARHRLQKKDPTAATSEPVKPIIYYLDRGAPEPIRSALLEGARWWNQAFEAAGYKNAFQVELMPEGADPMDLRYNVIQWVHRATRGWSYGAAVTDPRTGEILKGQVTLGSLRVRQDYLIAEGLLAPYEKGKPVSAKMLEMSLARLRQLAAHEVGHTLGLMHNFAASMSNRASVMDYPHPLVKLGADGVPDLSDAYATGIGEWDKVTIAYGYQDFPAGTDENKALDEILHKAQSRGLRYLTDQDARPPGGASPIAHLWDNGTNAVDELDRMIKVRATALRRFGENNIREHGPMATLEDVLVPVYLSHRYQVEAAVKVIGGLDYTFALRGDGETPAEIVSAEEQRRALEAVLRTLHPEILALPESLLRIIPPRPPDYPRDRENFRGRTGLAFDAVAPAEAAAEQTLGLLLNAQRAARLEEYHSRDAKSPGLQEVLYKLLDTTWKASPPEPSSYPAQIARVVNDVALRHLMALGADDHAPAQVRATVFFVLDDLKRWLSDRMNGGEQVQYTYAVQQISLFQKDPKEFKLALPAEIPAGQPIGEENGMDGAPLAPWFCDPDP